MKYLDEIGYDLDFRDLYNFHQDIWITMNHEDYIPLKEMGSTHIEKCINLIDKNDDDCVFGLGALWKVKLLAELKRRGRIE